MSDKRYLDEALGFTVGYVECVIEQIGAACESPIERGLLYAFVVLRLHDRRIKLMGTTAGPILTDCDAELYVQHQVGNYRLDFAIHVTDGKKLSQWIAVECDGHDFHERTKEQAQRDKARDRELTKLGFRIMRFTGSEIYRSNMACALQVHDLILSIAEGRQ